MDFAKFISLLVNDALYFACLQEFHDPYEGHLPKSHAKILSDLSQKFLDEQLAIRDKMFATKPKADFRAVDTGLDLYKSHMQNMYSKVAIKFGVNSWHQNEHESEAMWKLYTSSGQGIAIESTAPQLIESLADPTIYVAPIRYEDFENAPIERGHKHYVGFIKRKSFEHENELRAMKMLPIEGKGTSIKCDLKKLINKIHISPLLKEHIRDDIEKMCSQMENVRDKPVLRSSLFAPPIYNLD